MSSQSRRFKSGLYFSDLDNSPDKSSEVIYLAESREQVEKYCAKFQNLDMEYFLKPISVGVVENSNHWRICYENKLTTQLSEYIKDNDDSLFEKKTEKGKPTYAMSESLQKIMVKIILALKYLHSEELTHGNLSLETTYLQYEKTLMTPKLFGLIGKLQQNKR